MHSLLAAASYGAIKDPYWTNVKILLRGESATDSSSLARTVTTAGSVTYGTPSKYGLAAQYPSSGTPSQTVSYIVNHQLGTADFTIEGWIYKTAHTASTGNQVFYQHGASGALGLGVYLTTTGGVDFAGLNTYFCGIPAATLSLNTWYHLAIVRSSGVSGMYLNGRYASSTGPYTCTNNFNGQTNGPRIGGSLFSNSSIKGAVDDFRLTIGTCRYTADFTPPTRGMATS